MLDNVHHPEERLNPVTEAGSASAHDDHGHAKNEHVGGVNFWHFIDPAADIIRGIAESAKKPVETMATNGSAVAKVASPVVSAIARHARIIGVGGETIHVAPKFMNALEDFNNGKLNGAEFTALSTIYGAYALSGWFGLKPFFIKETVVTAMLIDIPGVGVLRDRIGERYVPHTLVQESLEWKWVQDFVDANLPDSKKIVPNPHLSESLVGAEPTSGLDLSGVINSNANQSADALDMLGALRPSAHLATPKIPLPVVNALS